MKAVTISLHILIEAGKKYALSTDWLTEDKLYDGQDLMPTSNTFDWIGQAVAKHWQLDQKQLTRIFPETI